MYPKILVQDLGWLVSRHFLQRYNFQLEAQLRQVFRCQGIIMHDNGKDHHDRKMLIVTLLSRWEGSRKSGGASPLVIIVTSICLRTSYVINGNIKTLNLTYSHVREPVKNVLAEFVR